MREKLAKRSAFRIFEPKQSTNSVNFPIFVASRFRKNKLGSFSAAVSQIGVWSIGLGVAVGIVSVSVLFGFKKNIQEKVFQFGAHIQVEKLTLSQSAEEVPIAKRSAFQENWAANPRIKHVQGVAHKAGILKTPDEQKGAVLKGIGSDFDWNLIKENIIEGQRIDFSDSSYSKDLIISRKMADQLRLKVGSSVVMYFIQNPPRPRKLRVVGIYETGFAEIDDGLVLGDIRLIQRLNNWKADTIGAVEVYLNDYKSLDQTAKAITAALPPELVARRITEKYPFDQLLDWLKILDKNTAVLLSLVLFVASFNIISVLLVLIMERTPMIGLLKTLGSRNTQIRRIFIFLGLHIISKGLLLGNVIGLGLCFVQKYAQVIPLEPSAYYMNTVPIEFDWFVIAGINLVAVVLITVVLLVPTYVISKIQPIEAMAFKK